MKNDEKFYLDFLTDAEYENVKLYFPCLFKKIMPFAKYFKDNNVDYSCDLNVQLLVSFISYLGSITNAKQKDKLFSTLADFQKLIIPLDQPIAGRYFKFKNGYLHENDFDEFEFCSNLSDAVSDFNLVVSNLHYQHGFEYLDFRDIIMQTISELTTVYDQEDAEMSSYQYAEIAYLKALYNEFKNNNIIALVEQSVVIDL